MNQLPLPLEPTEDRPIEDAVPQTGVFEQMDAALRLSAHETPTKALVDYLEIEAIKKKPTGVILSPEEINEKYILDKPATEPMKEEAVKYIADEQDYKRQLQETIGRGVGGVPGFALNFVAGAIPQVLDPINLGSNILISKGLGYLGTAERLSGTFTQTTARALGVGAKGKGYVAGRVLEDVAAGTAGEIPKILTADTRQEVYGADDYVANVIYTAGAFGALRVGLHYAKLVPDGALYLKKRSQHASVEAAKVAGGQMDAGYNPHVEPMIKDAVLETSPIAGKHTITPHTPEKSFFVVTKGETFDPSDTQQFLGHTTDRAIELSDNDITANGVGASKYNDYTGHVHEVRMKSPETLINLDEPLSKEQLSIVLKYLGGNEDLIGVDALSQMPGKNVLEFVKMIENMDELDYSPTESIANDFEVAGHSGYRSTVSKTADIPHTPYEALSLFNDKHIEVVSSKQANSTRLYKMPQSDLRDAQLTAYADKNRSEYSHEGYETYSRIERDGIIEATDKTMAPEEQAIVNELEHHQEAGTLDPDEAVAYDKYKEVKKQGTMELSTFELMKKCLGLLVSNG